MDKSIIAKWNKQVDNEEFKKGYEDAKNNKREFDDVSYGTYEVSVKKMELKASKAGDPMLSVHFKILTGKYKNQLIFMNQLVLQPFQIHIADEFMRSLDTDVEAEWTSNYSTYADLIKDVFEGTSNLEYALEYGENDKGYKTFKITDVFEK